MNRGRFLSFRKDCSDQPAPSPWDGKFAQRVPFEVEFHAPETKKTLDGWSATRKLSPNGVVGSDCAVLTARNGLCIYRERDLKKFGSD